MGPGSSAQLDREAGAFPCKHRSALFSLALGSWLLAFDPRPLPASFRTTSSAVAAGGEAGRARKWGSAKPKWRAPPRRPTFFLSPRSSSRSGGLVSRTQACSRIRPRRWRPSQVRACRSVRGRTVDEVNRMRVASLCKVALSLFHHGGFIGSSVTNKLQDDLETLGPDTGLGREAWTQPVACLLGLRFRCTQARRAPTLPFCGVARKSLTFALCAFANRH